MRVRGERECGDCGTRWSYYETGAVACPDCGSLRSVGVDDRTEHTDGAPDLDLDAAAAALAGDAAAYDEAVSDLRTYLRRRGYVDAGRLHAPDDRQLAVAELRAVLSALDGLRSPEEGAELYALSLLRAAESGDRPAPEEVPPSLRAARGLAYGRVLGSFRREAVELLDGDADVEADVERAARRALGALDDRVRRLLALDGDVAPDGVEALVEAARDAAADLEAGDAAALSGVRERVADAER
jgi:hypothetical protein